VLLGQIVELRGARLHREMIARSGVSPAVWVALLIPPIAALTVIALAYNHNPIAKPPAVLGRLKAVERILE
jgi:hypothetical protein